MENPKLSWNNKKVILRAESAHFADCDQIFVTVSVTLPKIP